MKQFWSILKFEYLNYAKTKVFVILTALLVVVMGVVLFFPRFSSGGGQAAPAEPSERETIALYAE